MEAKDIKAGSNLALDALVAHPLPGVPRLPGEDGDGELTLATWPKHRQTIIELFEEHVYGVTPPIDLQVRAEVTEDAVPLAGTEGTRTQLQLIFSNGRDEHRLSVLLCLPRHRPAPVFVGLNFGGNHTVLGDQQIALRTERQALADQPMPARGAAAADWSVPLLLEHGFGLATVWAGDIEPDAPGAEDEGIRRLLSASPADSRRWGTIGVWAWGLSQVRAWLAGQPEVRSDAIIAIGHSRMGKTALWAAAQDQQFAAAISNNSGCAGAALARHLAGESVEAITTRFPHWFSARFAGYADRVGELPVDQHLLLAAIAPRPLAVASGSEDFWSDPVGEYLATAAAAPIVHAVGGAIGYHLRPGGHGLTAEDWRHYLTFMTAHLPAAR